MIAIRDGATLPIRRQPSRAIYTRQPGWPGAPPELLLLGWGIFVVTSLVDVPRQAFSQRSHANVALLYLTFS
jgi:hypothetical protein